MIWHQQREIAAFTSFHLGILFPGNFSDFTETIRGIQNNQKTPVIWNINDMQNLHMVRAAKMQMI